ncbi:MAG TPA: RraA family protein [Pirellulales bacterium]|nr:RraA family protein [Pirellulales bacterium]
MPKAPPANHDRKPHAMTAQPAASFAAIRAGLYTAVVADVLDALGFRHQAIAGPLDSMSGDGLLVGRAKTTLWEAVDGLDPNPYELELVAVDACCPDDVLVCAAGGSMASGIWGELLSTAARNSGCAGAIVDGAVRDVAKMHALGFRVFARGTCPLDSLHRQRVSAVDVPVEVGGVQIAPGELVFADADGAVVVPRVIEAEALAKAWDKVTAENRVRDEIRAGSKAGEVFRKYGVL